MKIGTRGARITRVTVDRPRKLDIMIHNYRDGEERFKTLRRYTPARKTEGEKRKARSITNIKKYSARMERRKINQQLRETHEASE